MPSERLSPDPTPLIATLKIEGEKAGVAYDYDDAGFARKLSQLIARGNTPENLSAAFRKFCSDPMRGCSVYFFPEKLWKYGKATAKTATPKPKAPTAPAPKCPICGSSLHVEPDQFTCLSCRRWFELVNGALVEKEVGEVSFPAVLPWQKAR